MPEISLTLLLLSIFLGIVLGIFTGLTPGIHVNNAALFLVGISPLLYTYGFSSLYIAVIIISNSISHTFLDIIPSIFLGAPGEDTALAVLPGHRLLLDGRGIEAVRLSAFGSAASVVVSLILIAPVALLFTIAYSALEKYMAWIILVIALLLILSEGGASKIRLKIYAITVFMLAGALGYFAFQNAHLMSPLVEFGQPSILFPLLSGLFGASLLTLSLFTEAQIPPQKNARLCLSGKRLVRGTVIGSTSGAFVAWLPGVSAGVATVLARLTIREDADEVHVEEENMKEFLVSVNGVNTAMAIFGVIALFVIGKTRSGAMVAVNTLLCVEDWSVYTVSLFLLVIVSVAIISYFLTIFTGANISTYLPIINYQRLCSGMLIFLALSVYLLTGLFGLVVFAISITVGLMPTFMHVRKTHSMGVIMLPLILNLL